MKSQSLNPLQAEMAERLEAVAQNINPDPSFTTELESRLRKARRSEPAVRPSLYRQIAPALGLGIALLLLALAANWLARSLAPYPQPAADSTAAPTPSGRGDAAPPPTEQTYNWHGTPLSLRVSLPGNPAEAFVFAYQLETPATLESARALAAQLGMGGAIYAAGSETPDTSVFLVVDGNRWLYVRSDQYFQYYPDYPRFTAAINGGTLPANAEALIEEFMTSHGFDFDYRLVPSEMYGGLLAAPLTPDGKVICHKHFQCAGLRFTLDEEGILSVNGVLPKYTPLGQYGIISAEEALQQILEANGGAGMLEGMHSPSRPIQTWLRPRPLDETITIFGWMTSIPSAEGGTPLITLDGYTVMGNTADIPAAFGNTFVEATGQFHETNGLRMFELESWKVHDGYEDALLGTISRQGEQVIINAIEDEILVLPDVPAEAPLPLDNAFVIGVRVGGAFEWKSIDLRNAMGGGGGGGGGSGFYKLNLTGTPVPFPAPEAQTGGEQTYTVQAGDTLTKIADQFGVTVEALAQANGISDPSTINIGQTLVIPGGSAPLKIEGQRGMMSITIYKQADGSQRVDYGFINESAPFPYLLLQGENLEALQAYQNRPVDLWGTIELREDGQPVLEVERYEVPYPDLRFQILRGRQKSETIEGQPATLFTTSDGITYIQFAPYGGVDGSTVGEAGNEVLIEALIVPGETFGGYPAARVFAGSTAVNPKDGLPAELTVSADQIYTVDLAGQSDFTAPTAAIERIELVYYMPDPRYKAGALSPDEKYLQPAWLFSGHYSDGSEFFILVQALWQEFLLPETAPYNPPG